MALYLYLAIIGRAIARTNFTSPSVAVLFATSFVFFAA